VTIRPDIQGFTLIEIMVAIVIGALLLMLGLPSFTTFQRNSEIRSTAESILNGLRSARIEATRRNAPVAFTFVGGGPSWAIKLFDPVTATLVDPTPPESPLQQYVKQEAGSNSKVVITPANAVAVVFNGLGRIITPSPLATPNIQQAEVASVVAGQARTLRIYFDDVAGGHGIRMCDPDPALATAKDARAC
jgi:type IV fimbrial biogenesis protein FimT